MAFKAGAVVGTATMDTKNWNTGLKSMGQATGKMAKVVGGFALAAGAAFVAGMGVAVKKADEFQRSMSNVATVIDTSAISTQEMTFALLKMDPALGNATELTNGLYQAFSAGAPTAEAALQITEDSARFAGAALTDTGTAVDVLTTAVNAYGSDVVNSTQASDIFFTTIKQGKITGEQLAGTIGQSIPLFASTGIELEELAAGMAAMTKQGVSANESTTQLNAIVNSFLKPSQAMSDSLANIGYESGAAFLESEGLAGALSLLEDQTGGNADELAELLPNVRALRGAMALTGVGGEEFTSVMGEMGNSAGATEEAFAKQEKTFATLQNVFSNLMIVVGNIGKFFVDDIAGGLITATKAMITFITSSSGAQLVSTIVGTVAGVFTTLKEVLKPVVETIGPALKDMFSALTEAFAGLTENAENGVGAFNVFASVSQFAASAIRVFSVMVQGGIENIGNLIIAIKASGQTIGGFFEFLAGRKSWDEVKEQASTAGEAFQNLGRDMVENYADVFTTIGEEVVNFGDKVNTQAIEMEAAVTTSSNNQRENVLDNWGQMITGQGDAADAMLAQAEQMFSDMDEAADDSAEAQGESAEEVVTVWEDAFKDIENLTWAWGQETIGMVGDIEGALTDTFTGFADARVNKAQAEYDKREKLLEEQLEQGLISQEEHDKAIIDLENSTGQELDEAKKKQFEAQKRSDISSVWIDAASSIMGWWAEAPKLGPIAGPIFAGTMTGLTTAAAVGQTAAINSRQYVPAFEQGGRMSSSGLAQINESGGELVRLPGGATVVPNDISRDIAAASGGMSNNTTININNPVVNNDAMLNKMADRLSVVLGKRLATGVR